jgi:2-dehydropantoate 2-reductase
LTDETHPSIRRVSIIGAGAVGASYAAMLHLAGIGSLSLIAEGERWERLTSEGLTVNGRRFPVPVHRPREIPCPSDLIIVTVKHHHLDEAIRDMAPAVGPHTVIISLMNGIDSEERIAAAFGKDRVLISMVLGIDAVRRANEVTYSNKGRIFFGESPKAVSGGKVGLLKDFFDRAGIPYMIPDDMIRALWWKFMINVGINQASAALRAVYGLFQQPGEPRSLMEEAMREVIAIARKEGITLTETDITEWYSVLAGLSPDGKTSMLQDVEAGRPTEVEMFSGKVIELGRRFGIETPVNERLYRLLT